MRGRVLCSWRHYNHVYILGRVTVQIMLQGVRKDEWLCDLLPQVTVAHNWQMVIALGFSWISGTVNIGIATMEFVEGEKKRHAQVAALAQQAHINKRQQELRWGW